ncbi:MAG: hypothetical protein LBV46_00440 [Bacteroidales bacterium]|jgi:hypothetical protein|nr:hypothetical protein [Bacteroidales bacterium]
MHLRDSFNNLWYKIKKYIRTNRSIFEDKVTRLHFIPLTHKSEKYKIYKQQFSFSVKSKEDILKYVCITLLMLMLYFLPFLAHKSGISEQEYQNTQHAAEIYQYFATGDTAVFHSQEFLSRHPQMSNNIAYSLCQWFHVENVYLFNHYAAALFAWLTLLLVVIFLYQISGWRAAFIGLLLLIGAPRYLGTATSDLFDSSFAFFYLFGLTQIYHLCHALPVIKWRRLITLTLSIVGATVIQIAGLTLLLFMAVFLCSVFILINPIKKMITTRYALNFGKLLLVIGGIYVVVYLCYFLSVSYLPDLSYFSITRAIQQINKGIPTCFELFDTQYVNVLHLPHNYLRKYLFITMSLLTLIGITLFFVFYKKLRTKIRLAYWIVLTMTAYPIWMATKYALYGYNGAAIYLFLYPMLILMSAIGLVGLLTYIDDRYTNFVVYLMILLLSFMPIRHIILYPVGLSSYFNELSGGINNIGDKYSIDYNSQCNKELSNRFRKYIDQQKQPDQIVIGDSLPTKSVKWVVLTNGNEAMNYYFRNDTNRIDLRFIDLKNSDSIPEHHFLLIFANDLPHQDISGAAWIKNEKMLYAVNVEGKPIAAVFQRLK